MVDAWTNNYDRTMRMSDEISADLTQRNRLVKQNVDTTKIQTAVRRKLGQITNEIVALEEELLKMERNPAAHHITHKEISRRRNLLTKLTNRKEQLVSTLRTVPAETKRGERSNLLGAQDSGKRKSRGAWGAAAIQETEETRDLSNAQLLQTQERVMESQDRSLDALSATIGRQKEIANDIGTEVDVHVGLLDDMDGHVDTTSNSVQRESRRVSSFKDKAQTRGLMCSVIVLVLVIIVLLVIPKTII
eukprot:TRINITY_DN3308_c0_g1_i1.p1 TRINITY_DN3308_c0_g1~~TRINITY_DN3308_c0_g1_i1.p1  ORF type:complete len:247 (-),score=51.88 TRINITY_DN3308_c0_g1_i1:110-850(-)